MSKQIPNNLNGLSQQDKQANKQTNKYVYTHIYMYKDVKNNLMRIAEINCKVLLNNYLCTWSHLAVLCD